MKEDYICDFPNCGRRFPKKWRLQCHKDLHENKKPFKCSHEGCGAAYAWNQHLKRHVEKVHGNTDMDKQFQCSVSMCVAAFDTEHALSQHARRVHTGLAEKQNFDCSTCNQQFQTEWQLREHEASHTGLKPFKCKFCELEFNSFSDFQKHERSHGPRRRRRGGKQENEEDKKVIRCKECEQEFESHKELREHANEHSLEARTCKDCNIVFQRKLHLVGHQAAAHGEGEKNFKCTVDGCKRAYLYQKNLKMHMKMVHDRKIYLCDQCPRELSTKQKLLLHMEKMHKAPGARKGRGPESMKKKLARRLCRNGDSGELDIDVTVKRKAVTKNSHFSHVVSSKRRLCGDTLDPSNPIYTKYDEQSVVKEIPIAAY